MGFKLLSTAVVIFTIFLFYAVNEASSLQCYECSTETAEEQNCSSDDQLEKWAKNCTMVNHLELTLKLPGTKPDPKLDEAECVTVRGEYKKENSTASFTTRACMTKGLTENFYKNQLKQRGSELKNVKVCSSDLCNSSSTVGAGILSLCFSLILVFRQM